MCENEVDPSSSVSARKNVQFFDQLEKDPSRHLVLNPSRQRRRAPSHDTFERVQQANERWNHFFDWHLSTLDLVTKYVDQLNLCQTCTEHFISEPVVEPSDSIDSDDDDDDFE